MNTFKVLTVIIKIYLNLKYSDQKRPLIFISVSQLRNWDFILKKYRVIFAHRVKNKQVTFKMHRKTLR